jgi:hypothetical protein
MAQLLINNASGPKTRFVETVCQISAAGVERHRLNNNQPGGIYNNNIMREYYFRQYKSKQYYLT